MSLKVLSFHTHYTFICCVTHPSGVDNPTYFIFGSESYTTSKFNWSPNKRALTTKRTHGKPKVAQVVGGWLAFTPRQLEFSPHSEPLCPTVLWGFSDLKGLSVMGRRTAIRSQEWTSPRSLSNPLDTKTSPIPMQCCPAPSSAHPPNHMSRPLLKVSQGTVRFRYQYLTWNQLHVFEQEIEFPLKSALLKLKLKQQCN